METALKDVPISEPTAPEGITRVGGEWYFEEFAGSGGVTALGPHNRTDTTAATQPASAPVAAPGETDERKKLLDLFRN